MIINSTNPINLTKGYTLQVLYSNKLVFYDVVQNKVKRNSTLLTNCTVFKSFLYYTFCISVTKMIIYVDTKVGYTRSISQITQGESIIDVAVMRTVIVNMDYAYFLSSSKIYMILIVADFYVLNSVSTSSSFILTSDNYLYAVGDMIEIYDQNLILLKTIELPDRASAAWNVFDTLYIKIKNLIHIFQPFAPIIQSLIDSIEFKDCILCPSKSSTLILCPDSYTVFDYYCENICYDTFNLNFTLVNPDQILLGEYNLITNGIFQGLNASIEVESNIDVMLYSFQIFFDDSDLTYKPIIHYYDSFLFFSLDGKFRGYDITCELYMNGSLIKDEDFPVTVYT